MIWQDWVISVGQLLLSIALLPSIWSPHKPALSTSLLTAATLTVFSATFWTLGLHFAAVTSLFAAFAWWVLAYQKWRQPKV